MIGASFCLRNNLLKFPLPHRDVYLRRTREHSPVDQEDETRDLQHSHDLVDDKSSCQNLSGT